MKRIFALLLCALMLTEGLVSCSDNAADETEVLNEEQTGGDITPSVENAEETVEEETEEVIADDLPEITFDGHDFTIYNTNPESNNWYTTVHIVFEEDSGEPITSAIFNRNISVEERFDVKLVEVEHTAAETKAVITAGSAEDMDIALLDGTDGIGFIQEKLIHDLNTVEYIDLDKPYWDQNAREYLSIAGQYYGGVGDFLTTSLDETVCMYFNRSMVEDFGLDDPYDYVDNMTWTLDKFGEMGSIISMDANGDGKWNDQDIYAIVSLQFQLYPYLVYGTGETYVSKDENDIPYVAYYNERFISAFEKILSICHSNGDHFFYDADTTGNTMGLSNNHRVQEIMFPNNQALFWVECVCWARELREMETSFGIVPAPMLDETQGQYYNFHHGRFYGPVIPVTQTGESLDRTAIILEALNSHSTNTVLKAYYDVSLTTKISRDEKTGEMLDIVFNNLVYDTSIVYGLANINTSIYQMGTANNTDIASFYNRNKKMSEKTISKMIEKITEG